MIALKYDVGPPAFKHMGQERAFCEKAFVMKVGDYSFRRPSTTLLGMCSHGFQNNMYWDHLNYIKVSLSTVILVSGRSYDTTQILESG